MISTPLASSFISITLVHPFQFAFRSVKLSVLTHIPYFLQANTVAPRQLEALHTPIPHGLEDYSLKSFYNSIREVSDIEITSHFCRLHKG
jgi:hypothetical protein